MVEYEVIDTFGNQIIGVYDTRDEALYAIRLYCVARMMNKVSLFDQDFVTLIDNGDFINSFIIIILKFSLLSRFW